MRIAQINTYDIAGGAERVSRELHREYRRRGEESWLLVGCKRGDEEGVLEIPNALARNAWARTWLSIADTVAPLRSGPAPPIGWRVRRAASRAIGEPGRALAHRLGREDFHYPGSATLPELPSAPPDVLHAHNLHGGVLPDRGYFDLRLLPELSRRFPFVLTLHDAWLLSGHCAHSLDCERWTTGCGECPDLTIYPAVERDATAWNFRRKRAIYEQSSLYVATPCEWLMRKVERSMLRHGIVEARVIPYGVDLESFRPAPDPAAVRAELGLPPDAYVLLFAANGIRQNDWKDFETLRAAVGLLAERLQMPEVVFLALGESAPPERVGRAEIRFVPFERETRKVARYYQAANLYVHASRAETFPVTILEALASGTPVVASAVGGISEQVDSTTGALVPERDPSGLAEAAESLLRDERRRRELGANAAAVATRRYDRRREADDYLAWYRELVESRADPGRLAKRPAKQASSV